MIEALNGAAHDAANQVPWDGLGLYVRTKVPATAQRLFGKDGGARPPNTYANQIGKPIVLTGMAR